MFALEYTKRVDVTVQKRSAHENYFSDEMDPKVENCISHLKGDVSLDAWSRHND